MKRITIDPSDIEILIGRDIGTAQKLLRTIKDALGKKKHQRVTIKEFCDYIGFPFEDTCNMINKCNSNEGKTGKPKDLNNGESINDK